MATTFTLLVNPLIGTDFELESQGVVIPAAGGLQFTDRDEILEILEDSDLIGDADRPGLLNDNSQGVNSSTLVLQIDGANVPQADVVAALEWVQLSRSGNFSFVARESGGDVEENISFGGGATVSSLALGTDADAGGFTITNIASPVGGTDAATKDYVDSLAQGLVPKEMARVVSTTNVALTGTPTIDGVSTIAGDRVLLSGQTNAVQNGIWVTAAGAWSRPSDFATGDSAGGSFICVQEGTDFADTKWFVATAAPDDVIDSNPLEIKILNGATELDAGAGLTRTGLSIDVGAGDGIVVNADDVAVDYGLTAQPLGPNSLPGASTQVARADHVHAHGDRSSDGGTQHTASQVGLAGAYPTLSNPTEVEAAIAAIESLLSGGLSTVRELSYARRGRVPNNTQLFYLEAQDGVSLADAPIRRQAAGEIAELGITLGDIVGVGKAYELVVVKNGVAQSPTLAITAGQDSAGTVSISPAITYVAGDKIGLALRRTAGTGRSTFRSAHVTVGFTA